MKQVFRGATYALLFAASVLTLTISEGAKAFFAVADVNPILGTSYTRVNVATVANLEAQTLDAVYSSPKAREELWVKRVMLGADSENIFSDNMIGGPGSGKPFIRMDDLSKVDGNTINVPTMAGLGGPGTQGEGDRIGNEEKLRIGNFPVKIGRQWYGVGITDVAKEETVIGSQFDNMVNMLLRQRLGKKKSEDMMMMLKVRATASNVIRPNFKSTREALKSADTVGTTTISRAGLALSGLGGTPVKVAKGSAGDDIEQFLFFSSQYALATLRSEAAYLAALQYAGARGTTNPLFRGDFTSWDGHGIYRWYIRDHAAYGPVGSTILPRAFLGQAIPAVTSTAAVVYGGGDATGATILPAPNYFEFFSNSPYTFTNGIAVAADTTTVRYLAIINLTGADAGKIGFYSYKVNTGNTIQIFERLAAAVAAPGANSTVGNVTWNVGPWTTAASAGFAGVTSGIQPAGSLVVECNSYGVPFGGSFMLGEAAGVCGHGSLKGRNAMASRTYEDRNHDMDHGIGVQTVYGTEATKRVDGKTPNYVYVESAYAVDGFPVVA